MTKKDICAFLGRLTARDIDPGDGIGLTSAQKAQFAAWLRREGVDFDYAVIDRPTFTVDALLGEGDRVPVNASDRTVSARSAPQHPANQGAVMPIAGIGVGIDIAALSNMPQADDLRSHAFYKENFTPRELAHCLSRADERLSLCALWAAKEAILKSGAAERPKRGLATIEIEHDENGRPTYPMCQLSISHEADLAVAVCLRLGDAVA